jgi:hypothetical protein
MSKYPYNFVLISAFAKASTFAKATVDKSADRLVAERT